MGKCKFFSRTAAILLVGILGSTRLPAWGQSSRIIPLPELETVGDVRAEHGRIYIQDKRDIAVYSFDAGRFLRRIGRTGQGPGEFTMLGGFNVLSDRIVVIDVTKMVFYTVEGDPLGQMSPPNRIMLYPYLPVGKHFVGVPLEIGKDGSPLPPMGIIYDQEGKPSNRFIKVPDILPPPPPPPGSARPAGKEDVLMIRDYFDYIVHDGRIFVADSTKGFFISVFDETGGFLYEISHDFDRVSVSKEYRDISAKRFSDRYWESHKPVFTKYFPAIAAFKIDGEKIYAVTSAREDGRNEVVVMDLRGKILERSFRFPLSFDFWLPYQTARQFDVETGQFVWVEYNDSKERYELHIE